MAKSGQYSRSVLGASDEIKDIYCEPCQKDGKMVTARSHKRNKVLANHVLLDKDSMPITPGSKKGVLDVCEQKCTVHPDKVIELFCETCDKLGCTICITIDHRQCGKVKHIPDIVNDLKNSEEFSAFYEGIKFTTDKLSEFEHKIQANAISNNKMQKLAKQELKRQRAVIDKFFDELEKKMNDQILTFEKRNEDTLKKASDKLKPLKKDLDQIKNDIEEKKSGHNCELFISMKKSNEKMKTFDDQFDKMQGELTIQQYTLLPSEQIQAMMRNTTEICKISQARIHAEISKTPTARLESVIDIKTSKDNTKPCIYSLIIIDGHYCVVADNDNKSIKVVDTKRKKVTSEMTLEAKTIWSVTSVCDDQIVASVSLFGGKKQIQFFSISTSGVIQSTTQEYYVDDYYMDMVYCNGNIYGVHGGRIDILSMSGKIIKTIKTNDKGADLFRSLKGITVSPDGQTIYVTDSLKDSVTSLIFDGTVKTIYTNKDVKDPWGITMDKHGNIYVRSCGTKNIQQLTADLSKVQVLIGDVEGISITYSNTEYKLYLSDKGKINEYSLN